MPLLPRPNKEELISLPPRSAKLARETDVLVVGGGPAGLGAALGAAQKGARVVLVERFGFLGGNATAALVNPLMSFHTNQRDRIPQYDPEKDSRLAPPDHGPGDKVVGGALDQLLFELVKAKGAIPPSLDTGFVVPFDPEIFKFVAMDILHKAGVELLFHALA